ncbi:DUF3299 domain-containing protein [Bowmanella yangjiangensis]|uniref:DUF3299 domain-containing protein n=1 Tax=Bowmanella yangjiangensis TaxID=2811230 RepID=A0ABS3CWL5_9ALTE|nr:DUF3299 domain-containing protein [Bowmanella yangjiangensis]MBN7820965.1 DUF3299 domain-containing protein [Bowmanella yangjiangensis]
MRLAILLILVFPPLVLAGDVFRTIEWQALLPERDQKAFDEAPPINHSEDPFVVPQTDQQEADSIQQQIDEIKRKRLSEALVSTRIRAEFDQQALRLAGFVVPLEYHSDNTVQSAFLVPYFGACIHMPPPPPNQIIYLQFSPGHKVEDIYQAYWLSGILSTQLTENEVATAAYSMQVKEVHPYEG